MTISRTLCFLLLLVFNGCGSGGGDSYHLENEIDEQHPASFSEVVIDHLESPAEAESGADTGGRGWDTVYLNGEVDSQRTFCLDLKSGENHRAQIWSDDESVILDKQTSCGILSIHSGRVKIDLMHDGVSAPEEIFVYDPSASEVAMSPRVGRSGSTTIISDTGCPSCNLEGADLSNRDLSGMDFSRANLRGANLSNSVLSRSDFLGADLSEMVNQGADFSLAVWSDGTICGFNKDGSCTPYSFFVQSNRSWQDTGIKVGRGRRVTMLAVGNWTANPATGLVGPSGSPRHIARQGYTMPGLSEGALIARVGSNPPMLVGAIGTTQFGATGPLHLIINDDLNGIYGWGLADNIGTLTVNFRVTE